MLTFAPLPVARFLVRAARAVPPALAAVALAVVALVAVAPVAGAATDDDGASGVTWGVRTASQDLGADRQNYSYAVDPGERVVDAIVVTNHAGEPLELDLYAADGFTTDAGQLDVLTRDVDSVGVGAWVELATDHVRLEPGESLQVDFAVTVPAGAEPGDYAGAVVTSLSDAEVSDGVTVDRRLGIRIHLRVTGDLRPAMAVQDLRVDHEPSVNPFAPGRATVTYTVRNTGNVRLSADQAVTVGGPFGVARARTDLTPVPELLPGETWEVSAVVDGVWPLVRIGAGVRLDPALPEGVDGAPVPAPVRASAGAWAVPWSVLALVLVAAAAVLAAHRGRERRRRAEEARVQDAVARALRERDERDGHDGHDEREDPAPKPVPEPAPADA